MSIFGYQLVPRRALNLLLHVASFALAALTVPGYLRADDDYNNVGNPTGNAGQFNGNVS